MPGLGVIEFLHAAVPPDQFGVAPEMLHMAFRAIFEFRVGMHTLSGVDPALQQLMAFQTLPAGNPVATLVTLLAILQSLEILVNRMQITRRQLSEGPDRDQENNCCCESELIHNYLIPNIRF